MRYRIDLHCHSWFSADGVSRPEAMIRGAKAKGLNGFALTDHDTSDGCRYLVDQGLMRMDGKPVEDFLIIPGVEVSTAEGHLLCLGVMLPKLKGCPALEVVEMVKILKVPKVVTHQFQLVTPQLFHVLEVTVVHQVMVLLLMAMGVLVPMAMQIILQLYLVIVV